MTTRAGIIAQKFKEQKTWKTYKVCIYVRHRNSDSAKKLIELGLDATLSFEEKSMHRPKIRVDTIDHCKEEIEKGVMKHE